MTSTDLSTQPSTLPSRRLGSQPTGGPPVVTLERVLAEQSVQVHFQPVVDLLDGTVPGFEALARGPVGTSLASPMALFAAARAEGRLLELDQLCRTTAARSARALGLDHAAGLYLNLEPDACRTDGDPFVELAAALAPGTHVVVEFTERALTHDPAALLATAAHARRYGWSVALDDVGADPTSLALLPFLHPDVVKLDLRLVQRHPGAGVAAIVNAVNAYAERSGALVLAEGIETPEHHESALALGATLGQGWLFGRPGPLPLSERPVTAHRHAATRRTPVLSRSPFDVAARQRPSRRSAKPLLVELSKHLEAQAVGLGEAAVVLAAFERDRYLTPATTRRYAALAEHASLVVAFGTDLPAAPVPGVRGVELAADDPLVWEWDVVVLGPHFAAALVAREVDRREVAREGTPDGERLFDLVLSYDRDLVEDVALGLMSRVRPTSWGAGAG